ncbi:MAG: hypothetical protein K2N24_10195, partial [Lachnospiraceae bacterium]|nr:hypothetical protein [Lachnospiraceae bacterium]
MSTAKVTKTAKVEAKTADKENVKATAVKAEPAKTAAKTTKTTAKAEPAKTTKAAAKAEPAKAAKTTTKAATKTTAKKTTAKKAATKTTAKKTTAKATEEVFIQYGGGEVSTSDIKARVVEATGKKASSIKALNIYVQPETGKIYYTADGMTGEIASSKAVIIRVYQDIK